MRQLRLVPCALSSSSSLSQAYSHVSQKGPRGRGKESNDSQGLGLQSLYYIG